MFKNFTNLSKKVEIDDCYNCGGKFLDYYELNIILNENKSIFEKSKESIKKFFESMDYVDTANAPKYRRHKRSLIRKIFDKIFH